MCEKCENTKKNNWFKVTTGMFDNMIRKMSVDLVAGNSLQIENFVRNEDDGLWTLNTSYVGAINYCPYCGAKLYSADIEISVEEEMLDMMQKYDIEKIMHPVTGEMETIESLIAKIQEQEDE